VSFSCEFGRVSDFIQSLVFKISTRADEAGVSNSRRDLIELHYFLNLPTQVLMCVEVVPFVLFKGTPHCDVMYGETTPPSMGVGQREKDGRFFPKQPIEGADRPRLRYYLLWYVLSRPLSTSSFPLPLHLSAFPHQILHPTSNPPCVHTHQTTPNCTRYSSNSQFRSNVERIYPIQSL